MKYDSEALKLNEEIGNKRGAAFEYANIGRVYNRLGKYNEGLESLERALEINKEIGEPLSIAVDLNYISNGYLGMVKDTVRKLTGIKRHEAIDKAIEYAENSLMISKKINNLHLIRGNSMNISGAHELSGNYKLALENYKQATAVNDTIYNSDNRITIANLETKREADMRAKQVEINEVQMAKERNERLFFISGIVLLLLVTAVLFRNYGLQKKANKQKDMLMKEIHHRVKNNLQVISSLLSLQSETVSDTIAKAALAEGENRLRTIALIHQKLYQDDKPDMVNIANLTDDLFIQLDSVLGEKGTKVTFIKEIGDLFVGNDIAVPLGLIINELITNSYKYAFEKNAAPRIEISIVPVQGRYRMIYADNGPGLHQGFDIGESKSLGLKLVYGLARQIKGEVFYTNEKYSTFTINFG